MKVILILILIFSIQSLLAADVADPSTGLGSIGHEIPGCPINSSCSVNSGKAIVNWEKFLKTINEKNKVKKLKTYLKKHGLPLDFLTKKETKISLDPIMWNSRCEIHNPKNRHQNIFKGRKFLKTISKSEHMIFTPITVYNGKTELKYLIPYQDQPVLIKNGKIVTIKDYDDFYYQLAISNEGEISIENIPPSTIRFAHDKKLTEFKCPTEMLIDNTYFKKSYCQKIYDLDKKKLVTIQYGWSCP
ncbi:MAG: hypothetical protein ACJAS4_000118 [Bacteriovoracaceae bacterium]|jgi:hypothetical protein